MRNVRFCLFGGSEQGNLWGALQLKVLMRDERHGRVKLCFAACADALETRHGTLAVMRDYDSPKVEKLVKAATQAFQQFCTRRLGKPRPRWAGRASTTCVTSQKC